MRGEQISARIVENKPINIAFVILLAGLFVLDWSKSPVQQLSTCVTVRTIEVYQDVISAKVPFVHCRYRESCSHFAKRNFEQKGFVRGLKATVGRLMNCV